MGLKRFGRDGEVPGLWIGVLEVGGFDLAVSADREAVVARDPGFGPCAREVAADQERRERLRALGYLD